MSIMTALHRTRWRGWRHHLLQALIAGAFTGGFCMALGFLTFMSAIICGLELASADRAELDIKNIRRALNHYRARAGRYPTTQEGLSPLVRRGILGELPRDPWYVEYHYALWKDLPVIWSYGADGLPGGEGQDADISNRSLLPPWML